MFYLANFEPETGGYVVTFPNIPEAITCGDDFKDAMFMAEDVLICVIQSYFQYDDLFPISNGDIKADNQEWVYLPDIIYLKILVNNARLTKGLTQAQLARLTNLTPTEIKHVLTVRRNTKFSLLIDILSSLGLRLNMSVSSKPEKAA